MKLALIGYGKMGQAVEKVALAQGHSITCHIAQHNASTLATLSPSAVDLAIEFSQPQAAYDNIYTCLQKGIPIVAGTTGWLAQKPAIEQYCREQNGTFFYATNFSLAVHIFLKINTRLAQYMAPYTHYSVRVEETHHVTKKDKPSGTALQIVEGMLQHLPNQKGWSLDDDLVPNTIPISVYRIPNAVGTHVVTYNSPLESLSLQHVTWDRASLAHGVIQVAEWIQGKKGIFTMDDFFQHPTYGD